MSSLTQNTLNETSHHSRSRCFHFVQTLLDSLCIESESCAFETCCTFLVSCRFQAILIVFYKELMKILYSLLFLLFDRFCLSLTVGYLFKYQHVYLEFNKSNLLELMKCSSYIKTRVI